MKYNGVVLNIRQVSVSKYLLSNIVDNEWTIWISQTCKLTWVNFFQCLYLHLSRFLKKYSYGKTYNLLFGNFLQLSTSLRCKTYYGYFCGKNDYKRNFFNIGCKILIILGTLEVLNERLKLILPFFNPRS